MWSFSVELLMVSLRLRLEILMSWQDLSVCANWFSLKWKLHYSGTRMEPWVTPHIIGYVQRSTAQFIKSGEDTVINSITGSRGRAGHSLWVSECLLTQCCYSGGRQFGFYQRSPTDLTAVKFPRFQSRDWSADTVYWGIPELLSLRDILAYKE